MNNQSRWDLLVGILFFSIFLPGALGMMMWLDGEFDGADGVRNAIGVLTVLVIVFTTFVPMYTYMRKDAREFWAAVSQEITEVKPAGTVGVAFFGTVQDMPAWTVTFKDGTKWLFSNGAEPVVGATGNNYLRNQYYKRL